MNMKLLCVLPLFQVCLFCSLPEKKIKEESEVIKKNSSFNSKKQSELKKNSFNMLDFQTVVQTAKKFHLDKSIINESIALADAATEACSSLNGQILLFSDKYFEKNKALNIPKGKAFKLSPNDKFVLYLVDKEEKKVNLEIEKTKEEAQKDFKKKEEIFKFLLDLNFSITDFERVINYIEANINLFQVNGEKQLSMTDVYLAAANGYLSSIDPYSTVFEIEKWENTIENLNSNLAGVGMIIKGGGNSDVIIESPLEDSPALHSGIRYGDILLKVDGKSINGLSLENVIKLIKGKKDSIVSFEIKREGIPKNFKYSMKRDIVTIKNVTGKILSSKNHVAYIKVNSFSKSTLEDNENEIKNIFLKLEKEAINKKIKLNGIILDLRNNTGGYLDLAITTIDLFVSKGVLIKTVSYDQVPIETFAKQADISDLPLAILVNAKTASGAELVAGSIQDHGRGIVLGERTFGNGSVQKLINLPDNDDYILKITNSRFFLPYGNTPQVHGLRPDILISSEKDGSFPYSLREENKWKHLPEIPFKEKVKTPIDVVKIQNWVEKNGIANQEIDKQKSSPIRPDYFLYRAIDSFNGYLELHKNIQ
jgi:C-terminal peptidase prc